VTDEEDLIQGIISDMIIDACGRINGKKLAKSSLT
jgi:hypothetical protein